MKKINSKLSHSQVGPILWSDSPLPVSQMEYGHAVTCEIHVLYIKEKKPRQNIQMI